MPSTRNLDRRTNWERQVSEELSVGHDDARALIQQSKYQLGLSAKDLSSKVSKKDVMKLCRELSEEFISVSATKKTTTTTTTTKETKKSSSSKVDNKIQLQMTDYDGDDDDDIVETRDGSGTTTTTKKKKTTVAAATNATVFAAAATHDGGLMDEVVALRTKVEGLESKMEELVAINHGLTAKVEELLNNGVGGLAEEEGAASE